MTMATNEKMPEATKIATTTTVKEMLAALKAMVALDRRQYPVPLKCKLREQAERAIAKAEAL
jgi:hypothetical protein